MKPEDTARDKGFLGDRDLKKIYAGLMLVLLAEFLWKTAFYNGDTTSPFWVIFLRLITVMLGVNLSKCWKKPTFLWMTLLVSLQVLRTVFEKNASISRDLRESWLSVIWTVGACYPLGFVLNRNQLKKFFLSLGILWTSGMTFLAGAGIYAAWMRVKIPNLSGMRTIGLWGEVNQARLQMIFLSTISGEFMAVSILIALICMLSCRRKTARILFGLSVFPMLLALSLTDSRSAQISLAAGLSIFVGILLLSAFQFSPGHASRHVRFLTAAGMVFSFLLVLFVIQRMNPLFDSLKKASVHWPLFRSADQQVRMHNRGFLGEDPLTGRQEIWKAVLHYLFRHPLVLLTGKSMIHPLFEINRTGLLSFEAYHCHNIFLQILLENGLPGLLLLMVLLLRLLKQSFRLAKSRNCPLWQRTFPSLMAAICAMECVECLTWSRCHYLPFLAWLGLAAGMVTASGGCENEPLTLSSIRRRAAGVSDSLYHALPAILRGVQRMRPILAAGFLVCCLILPRTGPNVVPVIHQDDYADPETDLYYICGDPLCKTNGGRHTIKTSGCGLCAIVNAVCYLTGTRPDVREVAEFARSTDEYIVHEGSRATLYRSFADACGSRYDFHYIGQVETLAEAREYLKQGCVVIAGAGNIRGGSHVLVLADYSPCSDEYLILDSAGNYPGWSHSFLSWQTFRDNRPEQNEEMYLTAFRVFSSSRGYYRGF